MQAVTVLTLHNLIKPNLLICNSRPVPKQADVLQSFRYSVRYVPAKELA
jgi:hypothetical protein